MKNPKFERNCVDCIRFLPCPCGCNWGLCGLDKDEMFDGTESGCPYGCPSDGIYKVIDEDALFHEWKDKQMN